jgi:hypothetical protein
LRWLNAHSGWTTGPGPLTRDLRDGFFGSDLPSLLVSALILASLGYKKVSRRLPFNELRLGTARFAPVYPIGRASIVAFMTLGLAGVVYSLVLTAWSIEAYVWEGYVSIPRTVGWVWPLLVFGAQILVMLTREQFAAVLGLRPIEDAAQEMEDADVVRRALFAGDRTGAIRACREATGASLSDARRHVMHLADALYREFPERFLRDPRLPPPVNLRRAATLGATGAALVVLVTFGFAAPGLRVAWTLLFATGAAAGMTVGIAFAWPARWRRLLAVMCSLGLLGGVEAGFRWYYPDASGLGPALIGCPAGILLIIASRKRT